MGRGDWPRAGLPRRATVRVCHPGRTRPAAASAEVSSASEMSADQERTPLAAQYGSARETSQGIGRDWGWVRVRGRVWSGTLLAEAGSLPCDAEGQSSEGVAVRPPQS